MRVTSTQMNHQQINTSQGNQAKVVSDTKSTTKTSPREPMMATLHQAQTQLNSMADVDLAKVAELKLAIQEGRIELNVQELTQAMLKYHQG